MGGIRNRKCRGKKQNSVAESLEYVIRVVTSPVKMDIISLLRNFNSDFLTCDCSLHWVPRFFHSSSARLGEETLCAFPRSLRGKQLRGLKENQLSCGKII